jgi:hypothetical protein
MSVVADISDALQEAYATGPPIAPVRDRVVDPAMAYAVQQAQVQAWVAGGRKIVGRKIGLTAKAVQQRLGVDEPDFGTILDHMIVARTGKVELYSPVLEELGLDPLPGYQPPDQSRPSATATAEFPLILITGDRERSYHHSRFRDQPWALKVSPDPQLTMHPETAQALGLDGAFGGGGWQGHLPPAAVGCHAARCGQYRHGLVAAERSRAGAWCPRHQHQCRAQL